jgi:hypothetical protein
MSRQELKELLLPSDLVVPDEVAIFFQCHYCFVICFTPMYFSCVHQFTISIGELTGVLQTDLLLPVTKTDQMV